jgi:magnesium-protoporphyrin O-methyltransferase
MQSATYLTRRGEIEAYFDRTAAAAWSRLTSDAPVSGIRATVRAGREQMRATLLDWLPADLAGARVLDAGCGTGALASALALRGADVVAVDLSPTLIGLARERLPREIGAGRISFRVGDMHDPALGTFDHVVCMDSLIHYGLRDMAQMVEEFGTRARRSLLITFAPRTPLLATMHGLGRLFPRGNRAPAIEPVRETRIRSRLAAAMEGSGWRQGRTHRVVSGFYMSQALELRR